MKVDVEEIKLTENQRDNIINILQTHAQKKHFEKFGFQKRGKVDLIDDVINMFNADELSIDQLREWLALHQLDGNNQFFVFELNTHTITAGLIENLALKKSKLCKDITLYNASNLNEAMLVNIYHDASNKRGIFTYIAPAQVLKRIPVDRYNQQTSVEPHLYYASVIVDYGLNNIVISINPTSNLVSVDGVTHQRGFENISYHFLLKVQQVVGSFTIRTPIWISHALDLLAEEGTHHNNPEISNIYTRATPIIDEIVTKLLSTFGLEDPAEYAYVSEELSQAFENILIDKYGVQNEDDSSYKVFELKGDQVDSFVYVGSKSNTLNSGRVAKVAKATRNNSDLTLVGLERTIDKEIYRFYLMSGPDYYLIKNNSNKFVREEVVRDVILKLESYRRQIRDTSSADG